MAQSAVQYLHKPAQRRVTKIVYHISRPLTIAQPGVDAPEEMV